MEESLNGKLEEIQKVETRNGDQEVVIEDSGGLKTEDESAREIVVNGNSESFNENREEDDSSLHSSGSYEEVESKEKSVQKVDSGELDEEQIVTDSVADLVEPDVSSPSEELNVGVEEPVEQLDVPDDVAESESKEIEGNSLQSLDETNGVPADETNKDSRLIEEVILPSSDENDGSSPIVTRVVSRGIEEIPLSSSEKGKEEIPLSSAVEKRIEQIALPPSYENGEIPPTTTANVESKATEETKLQALKMNPEESSGTADLESKEKVDEPLPEATNAGSVDTNIAREYNPETTGNPPIISLTQRTIRPTSWRSCCGLVDVLRRTDR